MKRQGGTKKKETVVKKARIKDSSLHKVVQEWVDLMNEESGHSVVFVTDAVLLVALSEQDKSKDAEKFKKDIDLAKYDRKKTPHIVFTMHGDDHWSFLHVFNHAEDKTVVNHVNLAGELHEKMAMRVVRLLIKSGICAKPAELSVQAPFSQKSDWECGYIVGASAMALHKYVKKNGRKYSNKALDEAYETTLMELHEKLYNEK